MRIWKKYREKHVRYAENVLNFYQVLESMGRKSIFFREPSRTVIEVYAVYICKIKNDVLILYKFEMLVKSLEGIILLMDWGDNITSFSISIDAYKVSKTLALSTVHKAVIGGVHPNIFISVELLDQDKVNIILAGEKVEKAYELKTAVIYFQKYSVGTFPYVILCGRPQ